MPKPIRWVLVLGLCLVSVTASAQLPDLSQISQYFQMLMVLDFDQSGGVSLDEMRGLMPGATPAVMSVLDLNGDGQVEPDELSNLVLMDDLALILTIFEAVDTNHDLALSADEINAFSPLLGTTLLGAIDTNGDGAVTLDDIIGLLNLGSLNLGSLDLTSLLGGLNLGSLDLSSLGLGTLDLSWLLSALGIDLSSGTISLSSITSLLTTSVPAVLATDLNGDGCYSLNEIQAFAPSFPSVLFDVLDVSGNGSICYNDVRLMVADLVTGIDQAVKAADTDGDGGLSATELGSLSAVLTLLDLNGDGKFSVDDLTGILPTPPPPPPPPPLAKFTTWQGLLDALDSDGDGCLSYADIQKVAPKFPKALFDLLDAIDEGPSAHAGTDNRVCISGLRQYITLADVNTAMGLLISAIDTDADGIISWLEVIPYSPLITYDMFIQLDVSRSSDFGMDDVDGIIPLLNSLKVGTNPTPVPAGPTYNILTRIATIIHQYDRDSDGCLSFAELADLVPEIQGLKLPASLADVPLLCASNMVAPDLATLINAITTLVNGGSITFGTAHAILPQLTQAVFTVLDRNGDGLLGLDDFTGMTSSDALTLIVQLLMTADKNGDGCLSYDEAKTVIPTLTPELFAVLDVLDQDPTLGQQGDGLFCPQSPYLNSDALVQAGLMLVDAADANGDGKVTMQEAEAFLPGFAPVIFKFFDENGDGVLTATDLLFYLPEWSNPPTTNPTDIIQWLLKYVDANGDGAVTLAEAQADVSWMTPEWFAALDVNQDGALSLEDLMPPTDPATLIARLMKDADANGDGRVSFDEARALFPPMTEAMFAQLDRNGDHFITLEDMPDLPPEELQRLLLLLPEADVNGDLKLTYDELKAFEPGLTHLQFAQLDTNGDGVITPDDVVNPPTNAGAMFLGALRDADANHDGMVTFDELRALRPDLTQDQFNAMDLNGDGVLTLADVPPGAAPADEAQCRQLLQQLIKADTNHDGVLDYAEVAAAYPDTTAQLFAEFDANHDWVISRQELIAVLGQDGKGQQDVSSEDEDCDGTVSAVDLQIVINKILGRLSNFLVGDVDGNGRIDAVDLQRVLVHLLRGR